MDIAKRVRDACVRRTIFSWTLGAIAIAPACDDDSDEPVADEDGGPDQPPLAEPRTDLASGETADCGAALGAGACVELTVCDVFVCGGKTAPFNHFGCARVACGGDDDCGTGQRCFAVALDTACRDGVPACTDRADDCMCDTAAVACTGTNEAHCLPIEFYPATGDCDLATLDCPELELRAAAIDEARMHHDAQGHDDLAAQLQACGDRIRDAQTACAAGGGR